MKVIIQELDKLKDSRELLEAKPHYFLATFIFLVFIFILAGLCWAYFGEYDIVVKANGIVRPIIDTSTITSKVTGEIEEINFKSGDYVRQGEVLLRINSKQVEIDREEAVLELEKAQARLEAEKSLVKCITSNYPADQSKEIFGANQTEYYLRYLDYLFNINLLQNDLNQKKEAYESLNFLQQQGAATQKEVEEALLLFENARLKMDIYKNRFLYDLANNISILEREIDALKNQIKRIETSIHDHTIKAPISGIINVQKRIARGDIVQSGMELATVVADNSPQYRVELYISNEDIAKIQVGQPVKYRFPALPYSEYGEISGVIERISVDSSSNDPNLSGVYQADALIENRPLKSKKGEEGTIKVGMFCEARIVTGSKKMLYYLLEKMDLLIK